jgi:hypothetical protein
MSERPRGKPMELSIEIETHDDRLVFNLFESLDRVSAGQTKTIGKEVTMRLEGGRIREAVDVPSIIYATAFIGVVLPTVAHLLSQYLYDKLKDRRDNKLRIKDTQVEINAEKIEQLILIILKEEYEKKGNQIGTATEDKPEVQK